MRPPARPLWIHGSSRRVAVGFTLLEVVVALAVFAVVSALAWGGLDRLLRSTEVLDEHTASLTALQQAMGRYERDVRQAVSRPVRDGGGQALPPFAGSPAGLEFTRMVGDGGWARDAPALERVAWRCDGGRLQRLHWPVLDRTGATQAVVEDLFEGVDECRWEFVDGERAQSLWPATGVAPEAAGLPRGVEWRFRLEGGGELRRVLELPGSVTSGDP